MNYRNPILLLACLLPGAFSDAQTAVLPSKEETIELSPFVVSTAKDTGYIASDSLVGGRMSTNLLTTPNDVSVLTRDFMDDLALDSQQMAARWLTGAEVLPDTGQDFGQATSFRGLGNVGGGYPSRNYFKYNNSVEGYITERIEGARGPNALLFGDGVVGGVVNGLTKQARVGLSSATLQMRYDSEDSKRITLDVNQSLGRQAAIRVNLLELAGRSWIRSYENARQGAQIATTWRPWRGGEFRTEVEWMRYRTNYAPGPFNDGSSNYDGRTVFNGPLTALPAGAVGVSRFNTDRLVFGTTYGTAGVQNYRNFGATTGTALNVIPGFERGIPNFPSIARDMTLQPKNVFHQSNYRVMGAYFTQELGRNASVELAAQRVWSPHLKSMDGRWTGTTIDINAVLPNGTANPNFLKRYAETAISPVVKQDNRHTDLRIAAVYVLPVKSFSQRFNVIATTREETFQFFSYRYARSNGLNVNLGDATNTIFIRRYFDEPSDWVSMPRSGENGVEIGNYVLNDRFERQKLNTLQFAAVGSYWADRISLIGGARRDSYDRINTQIGTAASGRLANGQPNPNGYDISKTKVNVARSSVGVVVFPIKAVGVYANYSQSFNPAGSGSSYLDGTLVEPTTTTGKSAGLRFKLNHGKIVGSVGYYSTFERGRNAAQSNTEINRLWDNIGQSQKQVSTFSDSSTAGGSGYEADFVANVTSNLRVRLNFGKPDNIQRDTLPQQRKYFAANMAAWEAGANDPTNPFRTQIRADINTLLTRLENANEGRKINGLQKYTANFFANYTIPSGSLKSLRLGGGGNFVGRRIIGNQVGRPYDYYYGGAYDILTATAGYNFRWLKRRWDVQLNVDNLFDRTEPVVTGTTTFNNQTVKQGFYYLEPRKFTLSATVKF